MALAKSVTSAGLILYVSTALAIQEGIAEPILWFNDRMSVLGLNSNFVGIFSSSYFVAAVALSFFSQERKWKLIGFTTSILFSTGVIYSGSRLALLMSCTATFLFFLTKHERYRKTSLYVSALLILVVSVALLLSPQAGASPSGVVYEASSEGGSGFRALDELTRDTRSSHWKRAISLWMENPIFGVGWSEYRGRWTLHHSAYLQVLVESGILGAVVWAWVLWCCFTQCRYVYLNRRLLDDWEITTAELGMAVIGVCLIHAFGESALLAATMPLAVALGVATQLLDESASNIAQIRSAYHGLEHEASDEPRWDDTVADQVD
jgi:O-antigen ligase